MKVSDEKSAEAAIAAWRGKDNKEQLRNILNEIESLDLSVMYYETRENKKGIIRSEKAIAVLTQRKKEIETMGSHLD